MPPFGDTMVNQKREAEAEAARKEDAEVQWSTAGGEGFFLIGVPTTTSGSSPVDSNAVQDNDIYTGSPNFSGPQPTWPPGGWPHHGGGPPPPWPPPYDGDDGHPHPLHSWGSWNGNWHDHDNPNDIVTVTESIPVAPYKDWDHSTTGSIDVEGGLTTDSPVATVTYQATVTAGVVTTEIYYTPSGTSSSPSWSTAGDGVAQADSSPFAHGENHPHSPLRLILLGAFLGAGFVMSVLACIVCTRKIQKRSKKARRTEADARDAEGQLNMQMSNSTTRLTTAMAPNETNDGNVTLRRVEYAHRESSGEGQPPIIINPFSDPTYNASSGLDDYIVNNPASGDIGLNPFAHPENPFEHPEDVDDHEGMECAGLLRPNSDGDFPPEYMTIDNDHVAGMGPREERFPFGDEALSDSGSLLNQRTSMSGFGASGVGAGEAGFGDGFRGYTPGVGLGAELGEGMGEGFSGHIPYSDTATLTDTSSEQRMSTIDMGSVRDSMMDQYQLHIHDVGSIRESMIEYPQIRLSQDLDPVIAAGRSSGGEYEVADGFGYRPGMGATH